MESPRQLYSQATEGWDHSPGGYLTLYWLVLVCLALAVLAYHRFEEMGPPARHFLVCMGFNGVSFLGGGVAHQLLDTYVRRGDSMGRSWGDTNTEWMFAWFFVSLCATGAFGMVAVTLTFSSGDATWKRCGIGAMYVVGGLISFWEVLNIIVGKATARGTQWTGTIAPFANLLAGLVASVLATIELVRHGKPVIGTYFFVWVTSGRLFLVIGTYVFLFSLFFVEFLVPSGCRQPIRENCPFPEWCNHNACFHLLQGVFVIFLFLAVVLREDMRLTDDCESDSDSASDFDGRHHEG